jgi:hypothetical protein
VLYYIVTDLIPSFPVFPVFFFMCTHISANHPYNPVLGIPITISEEIKILYFIWDLLYFTFFFFIFLSLTCRRV